MKLVIGNKNYSTWSLRAWLLLSAFELSFDEVKVSLSVESTAGEIAKYSKAGKVPVLHDDGMVVWDSLAICEYVSEQYLGGAGWPEHVDKRAMARSCAAEMHSSFTDLRSEMPMNCRAVNRRVEISPDLQKDISRIDTIWTEMRSKYANDGPWLFGDFSIADCMFAPVVFRFATYKVAVSPESKEYMENMLNHPKMKSWLEQAKKEVEVIEEDEAGV